MAIATTSAKSGGGVLALVRSLAPFAVAIVLALVLQFLVKPLVGDYMAKLMLDMATNVILGVSLTMVNGFTGQFSMGHAAFMLVGGYVAAMIVYYGSTLAFGSPAIRGGSISGMSVREGAPFVASGDMLFALAAVAGGLVAAGCGYLVGLPSLRLKGDYLAIVTLGFGEMMRVLIQAQTTEAIAIGSPVAAEHIASIPAWKNAVEYSPITEEMARQVPFYLWPRYVGGALGFTGLPFYTSLFWAVLIAGITIAVAMRLKQSTFGRAFLAIREDEIAAEAMGVDTTRYKIRAFVISAFFAGLAGALFAHTSGVQLNPGELGFQKSFDIIIIVVLGGLGSISGAAIAAVILTYLPEWLREPGPVWYYGLAICIAIAIFKRDRKWKTVAIFAGVTLALEAARLLAVSEWAKAREFKLSDYRMVLYALMLIVMMILRPEGLLGTREVWERSLWKRGARGEGKKA